MVFNFYRICSIIKIAFVLFQHLLCSSTNPIFGKIFVPDIWTEILSANRIVGFFNQPFLQNKSMKQPDFLHVNTNSRILKVIRIFLGGYSQKLVWPVWPQYSKTDCVSRMNRYMNCFFLYVGTNSRKLKVISMIFGWTLSKRGEAIQFTSQ